LVARGLVYELRKDKAYETSTKGEEYLKNLSVLVEQAWIFKEKRERLERMLTAKT
jgi:hypothetical protein